MFEIELKDATRFDCSENETVFQAAKNSGVLLEHSCLSGRCSSCKAKLISGRFEHMQPETVLTAAEREAGYMLSCIARPLTDIKLDIEDLMQYNIPSTKTIPAKIERLTHLTDDVVEVVLRTPPAHKLKFLAGQYVNIIKGSVKRSYSIASAPRTDGKLAFLIRRYKGGVMSQYWFHEAQENDLLRVEGPLGTFFLRDLSAFKSLILLATGTGIAPVKAILEQAAHNDILKTKEIHVFWGGRYIPDLFWEPQYGDLDIKYYPVLSREKNQWTGHLGYVQDVVLQSDIDLATAQVYACGSEAMIHASKQVLTKEGLQDSQFYSDAFVTSN